MILLVPNAWSADRTLTMYFMGTGITSEAHIDIESPWNAPEVLSETYYDDNSREIVRGEMNDEGVFILSLPADTGTSYKYIADGIGTTDGEYDDLLGQSVPDLGKRGWAEVQIEALSALALVLNEADATDELTINLLGFSRGGVSAIMMAHAISTLKDTTAINQFVKINILAFDPVPGMIKPVEAFGERFNLSSYVNQFVGVYADNERSYLFEPLIPNKLYSSTKSLLLRLPGAHETLVGNLQYDGHAFALGSYPGNDTEYASLTKPVRDTSRWLIEFLLTSPEWGSVSLNNLSELEEYYFQSLVSNLHSSWPDFKIMQMFTFTAMFGGYNLCYSKLNKDHQLLMGVLDDFIYGNLDYESMKRLTIIAPHSFNGGWFWVPCGLFGWPLLTYYPPIYTQAYDLNAKVTKLASNHWDILNNLRGDLPSIDETPPVADIDPLVEINAQCTIDVTALSAPQATDDVDGTIIGTPSEPLYFDQQGEHSITWTYTDNSGNSTSQIQAAIIADTEPPTPDSDDPGTTDVAEGLPTVQGECPLTVTTIPTATDNCSGTISGTTSSPLSFDFKGVHSINWLYTDAVGNSTLQSQSVEVEDTTPPIPTCPSNIVVEPTSPSGSTVEFLATASDTCSPSPKINCTRSSGDTFSVNTQSTVVCTAVDHAGLENTCSFNVKVLSEIELVLRLLEMVSDLEAEGINPEISHGLRDRLLSILDKYEKGGPISGCCNKISSLINKLSTEVKEGRLTPLQAQSLINTATNLLNTSSCQG